MIDHLDRDAASLGLGELAGRVAAEGSPCLFVDFGLKGRLERRGGTDFVPPRSVSTDLIVFVQLTTSQVLISQ